MNEITIELNDEVIEILDRICESEGVTWEDFVSIMAKYYVTDCPYRLSTLESYIELY